MAWRTLVSSILESVLRSLDKCVEGEVDCAELLIAAADALYSPLGMVDAGFGEARRLASKLASLVAAALYYKLLKSLGEEGAREVLKKIHEALSSAAGEAPSRLAEEILREANVTIPVSYAPEPREAIVKSIADYLGVGRGQRLRRRRQPRKPDPLRDMRRILREIGRRNPMLAYALSTSIGGVLGASL